MPVHRQAVSSAKRSTGFLKAAKWQTRLDKHKAVFNQAEQERTCQRAKQPYSLPRADARLTQW